MEGNGSARGWKAGRRRVVQVLGKEGDEMLRPRRLCCSM